MIKLVIEELIKERGLHKSFIAKQIGVSNDTLTNWMKNRSAPKLDKAVRLADILNCDVNDLYKRTD